MDPWKSSPDFLAGCRPLVFLSAPILVLALARSAGAHNAFGGAIEHQSRLALMPTSIDLEVCLTWHETAALEERRRMDLDGNGWLDAIEVRTFADAQATHLPGEFHLVLDGRTLPFVTHFAPGVDLGGEGRVAPGHFRLLWRAFARLPAGLGSRAEGWFEDRALESSPAISTISGRFEDGTRGAIAVLPGGRRARISFMAPAGAKQLVTAAGLEPPAGEETAPRPEDKAALGREEVERAAGCSELLLGKCRHLTPPDLARDLDSAHRDLREALDAFRRAAGERPGRPRRGRGKTDRAEPIPAAERERLDREAQDLGRRGLDRLASVLGRLPARIQASLEGGAPKIEGSIPARLPGCSGGVALRLVSEGGARAVDFAPVQARPGKASKVELGGRITWVLALVEEAQPGAEPLRLSINRGAGGPVVLDIPLEVPAKGRIEIVITDGAGGAVVPAMVSPRWEVAGTEVPPEGALDLTAQWDGQGNRGSLRRPRLAEGLSVAWWCIDGRLKFDADPGPWRILIRRGTEYAPVEERFDVGAGERVERRVALERWTDSLALGWLSGDDHVHAQILSDEDAERILLWARAEDVRVVNVVKMGDIHRTYFEQRGFGRSFRRESEGYVLVPGQECPRTHEELGHTLALNLASGMVRDAARYFLYDLMFDGAHAQGGLTGYAHVNSGAFHVHRDMSLNVPKGKVDFVELLQFAHLDPALYYDFLNLGFRLTASAGSDIPWGGSLGDVRVYARCPREATGGAAADAWYDSVRRGRTFVTNGPMIELDVEGAGPGDEVRRKAGERIKVRARAWGFRRLGAPRVLRLVRFGEVVREVAAGEAETEVRAEVELDVAGGFWIAAHVLGRDGTQAHTSPAWVIQDGLRPWKYGDVADLLARRRSSLKEIEKLYEDRRSKSDDPFVGQWRALSERIEAARRIYDELEATAVREKALRGG